MSFYDVQIGKIISFIIEVNHKSIITYYKIKDIREENYERIITAVLVEETKELIKTDIKLQSEITLDFSKWSDSVFSVFSNHNEIFLQRFINNEDVDGAAKYALTLDKEEAVSFLKDFSMALVDLVEEARERIDS